MEMVVMPKTPSNLLPVMLLSCLPWVHGYTFVDLSHDQTESTIYWPTVPHFNWTQAAAGTNEKGVWIESGAYSSGEHGGTHVDVPKHFVKDGLDLSQFPLDRTVADGVMIDCSTEAAQNKDYAVTVEKIKQWEEKHGRIPNEAGVLIYFGYASKFANPAEFFNTPDSTNIQTLVFPYVSAEAAQWLLDHRNMKILGMDVASPDRPQNPSYPVHVTLLSKNIMILENVNIPTSLPPRDFRLYASPIKVVGGTGIQTRIYAMLYDSMKGVGKGMIFGQQSPLLIVGGLVLVFTLAKLSPSGSSLL